MNPLNDQQRQDTTELWEKLSLEQKVEIDMAIGQGNKIEAVKRCRCAVKDLDLLTAQKVIEKRASQLAKRKTLPKK